ncbi:hypothetical protein PENANT_c005G02252 [Penicillium antarcticum]|uniref:DUF6546 domain-containing protein n=1 Tax=Penicillium antarcticum TaxID=416450 RepID=A0A1V6QF59_9EURO|nr:hypothetical protein PENANT_c005G02252 [Penicillium antarcticum]
MSWSCLPAEIRVLVLEALLQDDGCSLAGFAIVSREWQMTIELHNFAHINLTLSRLADFGPMIHRNRALVAIYGFAWNSKNMIVPNVHLMDLFSMLSTWKPNSNLLLDISVHSPSDSEHWFKYLTFEPDITSDECGLGQYTEQSIQAKLMTTSMVFDEIMGEGPFNSGEEEDQWWKQLPLVPEVTGVLLRQQNRQRWKPTALAQMFARFPRLQEICYEPWREWCDIQQEWTDQSFRSLLNRSLLVSYEDSYSSRISLNIAKASLKLECLSASFIVGTSYFFNACDPHWKWPNMTSLTLTSHLLTPDESLIEIDNMLQNAAAVAMKMPNLTSMEI